MRIIIKYLLNNIKEKKMRSILVIFAILVSSALFFASNAIGTTTKETYIKRLSKYYGQADIMIYPRPGSPDHFFHSYILDDFKDSIEGYLGVLFASGKYHGSEDIDLGLYAVDLEELQQINPVILPDNFNLKDFSGPQIIINQVFAEKIQKKTGDFLDLDTNGIQKKLKIAAVIPPTGPLSEDPWNKNAILPFDYLSRIYHTNGRISQVYIKSKDHDKRMDLINRLTQTFPRLLPQETIREPDIENWTSQITMPFLIMVTLLLCTSIFIIFTSFQVICKERLPVIGTFRSIGATKWDTSWLFIIEALFYGITGGLIGIALGFVILYMMTWISLPQWLKDEELKIFFTNDQLISSFFLAVLISMVSSLIPILTSSRIPPKDVILNTVQHKAMNKKKRLIAGIILVVLGLLLPYLVQKELILFVTIISMIMLVAAVIQLSPFLSSFFINFIQKIYLVIFGNLGVLSAKNLKDNAGMQHNISLLAIGISSLLLIYTISTSVNIQITDLFKKANFEIMVWSGRMNLNFENTVRGLDGVKETYGIYDKWSTEIEGMYGDISSLQGIDTSRYNDFWQYHIPNKNKLFKTLDNGRNIILGIALKQQFDLELGDIITLKMDKGPREYRIIGFFDTLWNSGSHGLISQRFFKMDNNAKYYSDLYVRTEKKPEDVIQIIKNRFARSRANAQTIDEMAKLNKDANNQMFILLQGFSIMALVIGVIGVINNFILGFIERKKSLALLRTVGLSQTQMIKMIFIEALTQGLIGGIAGLLSGCLMIVIVPRLLTAMELYLPLVYSPFLFIIFLFAGAIICMAASISPALRSKKLNTLEALKYE
ncbi:MAG: FtsX-like permease family protein [Spirochaetales bacterium]|nr:FtsX-like permease family protein [Spirochaetales bacterium]